MLQNDENGGDGDMVESPPNSIVRIYNKFWRSVRACIGKIRKDCSVRDAIQSGCFIVFILSFVISLLFTVQKDNIDRKYNRFKKVRYNVIDIVDNPVCLEDSYRSACLFKENLRPPCVDYIVVLKESAQTDNFANFSANCHSCGECTRDWLEIFTIGEIVSMYRDSENHNNVRAEPPTDSDFLNPVLYGLAITCLVAFCVICCSHHCCGKKSQLDVENEQHDRENQRQHDMLNADLDC